MQIILWPAKLIAAFLIEFYMFPAKKMHDRGEKKINPRPFSWSIPVHVHASKNSDFQITGRSTHSVTLFINNNKCEFDKCRSEYKLILANSESLWKSNACFIVHFVRRHFCVRVYAFLFVQICFDDNLSERNCPHTAKWIRLITFYMNFQHVRMKR